MFISDTDLSQQKKNIKLNQNPITKNFHLGEGINHWSVWELDSVIFGTDSYTLKICLFINFPNNAHFFINKDF